MLHFMTPATERFSELAPDPADVVRKPKQQPGADIWLRGGGTLATELIGEIDCLVFKRNPFLVGDGIPLFARGSDRPERFTLQDSTAYASGLVVSEYVRDERTV